MAAERSDVVTVLELVRTDLLNATGHGRRASPREG